MDYISIILCDKVFIIFFMKSITILTIHDSQEVSDKNMFTKLSNYFNAEFITIMMVKNRCIYIICINLSATRLSPSIFLFQTKIKLTYYYYLTNNKLVPT